MGDRAPAGAAGASYDVQLPSEVRYRMVVGDLVAHQPGVRVTSVTVSSEGVRVARGADGFPAAYLNPLGMQVVSQALAARGYEALRVRELRLRRAGKHLRWHLEGTAGGRPWSAEMAPNGTGLH